MAALSTSGTPSELDIANLALLRAGNTIFIASVTESTNHRTTAELLYPFARNFVLAEGVWDFALKRAALTTAGATDVANWAYKYTLPSDSLRVLRVFPALASTRKDEPIPFQVIGAAIYCNEATASVEYVFKETTTANFHPQFVTALGYYLGSELAQALRADAATAKSLLDAYLTIIAEMKKQPYQHLPQTTRTRNAGGTVTDVSICNMALTNIGFPRLIAALTDNTDEARVCDMFFERCRDMLLEEFPWKFTKKRATLVTLAGTLPTHWAYKWSVPTDMHVAWEIEHPSYPITPPDQKVAFEVSFDGSVDAIYTNVDDAVLVYGAKVTAVTRYSPHFVDALSWALAARLVFPLSRIAPLDPKMQQLALSMAQMTLGEAKVKDVQTGYEGADPDNEFLTARA